MASFIKFSTKTSLIVLAIAFTAMGANAKAEEGCEGLVQYLWTFQPGMERTQDPSWDGLTSMSAKLHQGSNRLAAPGSVEKMTAYPFPNVPSSVANNLDRDTLAKVKGLYERYVLLDRSIVDTWKDQYSSNASSTAMQKFVSERNTTIKEMSHIAKSAKDELVKFAFKTHSCFDSYESFVTAQNRQMEQQVADAKATLHTNEEIYAQANEFAADTSITENEQVGTNQPITHTALRSESISGSRAPASVPLTAPAVAVPTTIKSSNVKGPDDGFLR